MPIFTKRFDKDEPGFRCFGEILELAGLDEDEKPFIAEGDSGAWVVDEIGGVRSWDGIMIAHQGVRGYASFAEHALESLRQVKGPFPAGLRLPHEGR